MIQEGYRAQEQKSQVLSLDDFTHYFSNTKILLLILFIATLIVYFNSFNVPFYLDDYPSIVENTAIHDITEPEKIWGFYFPRFVGYLSFALNYSLGGISTFGYHIVNFLIHFLAGISVFYLTRLLIAAASKDKSQSFPPLYLYTIPFVVTWPSNTRRVDFGTPAARKRRPNVCFKL